MGNTAASQALESKSAAGTLGVLLKQGLLLQCDQLLCCDLTGWGTWVAANDGKALFIEDDMLRG